MTLTVLKTEFVKADPIKMNYRDYKNYNSCEFNKDLKRKLISDPTSNMNYTNFQNMSQVLENHAPLKTKYLRAHHL